MKYLTIKEFAKIHNVNTRTLHYYDNEGLFSPKLKGENGYRYYSYAQSAEFEIILALRELSVSIEEIKAYTERRSAVHLEKMLSDKSLEIDKKIKQLKQIKNALESKISNLALVRTSDLNKIEVVSCKPEFLFLVPIDNDNIIDVADIGERVSVGKAGEVSRIFNTSYGSMIPVKALMQGNFEDYSHYFVKVQNIKDKKGIFKKNGGEYIRAYSVGEWEKLPKAYERILKFAQEKRIKLSHYSYEQGINEMAINSMSKYVTEIMIKCESK